MLYGISGYMYGNLRKIDEPEECNPENFGEGACYFCQNHDYCKAEYEKFVDVRQEERGIE